MFVSVSSNLLAIHFCSQMLMSVAMAAMFAMLIRTVTTEMVLIFVLAKKDTLEMDSHVKVSENITETSSFAHKQSLREISSHFRGLFLRTTPVFLLDYFLYANYALDIDECSNGSHDCDVNANCTNTNGSHSCTCKEGYTGKGESCQGKIRLDLEKKHNNCSSQIIVLLSNKLAKIVFCFIQLPFANLSCSQILMNATMKVMFVMLMLTVPTQMVYIIASVRKDTL